MNSTELRIGNIVSYEATAHVIREIHGEKCLHTWNKSGGDRYYSTYEEIEGFPITPEWLERFGWTDSYSEVSGYYYDDGYLSTSIGDSYKVNTKPLKFIHEIQNLYWCLCGKELEIKPYLK